MLRFVKWRPEKIHQKSPPFFNAKFPGKYEKNIHKMFLESRQSNKPKLFGPDIFGWGGRLPREGVEARKFGVYFETQGNQTFGRDIPGFCRDIPELPEKLEKKKGFVFNSCALQNYGGSEKSFQELISANLLILLWDKSCLELIIISSHFLVMLFLQDKLLESV